MAQTKKRILTVGISVPRRDSYENAEIENLGLCSAHIERPYSAHIERPDSASPLYEYDAIIINPASFNHFLFGVEGTHSYSKEELSDLKRSNARYDFDELFDRDDRCKEMDAALSQGCFVVWCLARSWRQNFFGYRETTQAYLNSIAEHVAKNNKLVHKTGRRIVSLDHSDVFYSYFEQLRSDGWQFALASRSSVYKSIAATPEGYSLGGRIDLGTTSGWLLTPPTSDASKRKLIDSVLAAVSGLQSSYDESNIFLSHTHVDKPFVNRLKADLLLHGIKKVWVDEAEIKIGDSLLAKIEEGLRKSRFVGVVLSPRSINAPWVRRELEIATDRELKSGKVVVLPILFEKCELPAHLRGKLYADFTEESSYQTSFQKLLERVRSPEM